MFTTALKLGSLQAAHWLTSEAEELLRVVEGRILDAAVQNGYVDDYGEDDALRTIENGVDLGRERPWDEPVWNAEYFPQPGMPVVARTADGVIARGHIAAFREGERGWEFRLEERPRVWFAQGLLFPAEAGERVTGS